MSERVAAAAAGAPAAPRATPDAWRRARSATPLIGCPGWRYRHRIGSFYGDAKPSEWLAAYATRLDAVEINATFYRWPPAATFRRWRDVAPRGFRFVVKGPRRRTCCFFNNDAWAAAPHDAIELVALLDRARR